MFCDVIFVLEEEWTCFFLWNYKSHVKLQLETIWFIENDFRKIFYRKWLSKKYFYEKKKRGKRKINTRKISSSFENKKIFCKKKR